MSDNDEDLWFWWKVLAAIVLVSTTAFFIATHGTKVELNLIEGEKVNVKLFRFLPDNIPLKLLFSRVAGVERPELGKSRTIGDWRETGVFVYENPGEPIKLVASDTHQKIIYEALPTDGYYGRSLIAYYEDNNPSKFWPGGERFLVKAGFSEFQITILEVGKSFVGEKVTLYISPPLGFKFAPSGFFYKYLFLFHAWPIYVLILLIFYFALLYRKRHYGNKNLSK